MYSPMIVFIVVAKYLRLKQNSIARSLQRNLSMLHTSAKKCRNRTLLYSTVLYHNLLAQVTRYCHLQEELHDYNHFWSSGLSVFFLSYCFVIAYIFYLVAFAPTSHYIKYLYSAILYFHILLICAIMHYSAAIVYRHEQLRQLVSNQTVHLLNAPHVTARQSIKVMVEALRFHSI